MDWIKPSLHAKRKAAKDRSQTASPPGTFLAEPLEKRTLFSSLTNITNRPDYEVAPDVTADASGGLHATYQGGPLNSWHVMYMYKPSGGSWTTPLDLGGTNIQDPHICVGGAGNPHIVYEDNNEIYWLHKINGAWTSPIRLSTAQVGRSLEPDITADGTGKVHVVWHDEYNSGTTVGDWDIRSRTWDSSNDTWSTEVVVSNDGVNDDVYPACVGGGVGALYVTWYNSQTNQVLFRKRDPAGVWQPVERVDTSTGRSFDPSIAIDNTGTLHVAWHDDNAGNWNINYRSRDGGGTWSAISSFDTGSVNDVYAHVAINPVNQGVVIGFVDLNNAFVVRKPQGGAWGAIKNVGSAKGAKDNSVVFDSAGNVNFIFQGNKGGTNGGSWDLWYYVEDINGN